MEEELKACPFCGHEPQTYRYNADNWHYFEVHCQCPECSVEVSSTGETLEEAVAVWNTRPAEDALRAKWEGVPWDDIVQSVWVALHCGTVIDTRNQEESACPEAEIAAAWLDEAGLWDSEALTTDSFDPDYQALWEGVPWRKFEAFIMEAWAAKQLERELAKMNSDEYNERGYTATWIMARDLLEFIRAANRPE